VVKAWKAGTAVEIAHGTSAEGSLRILLPKETKPGLLNIEFTGDCPLNSCELVFSGSDIHLQLLKGEDGRPRLFADRETEFYWRANQIIDSLRQSLLELRKLLVVFAKDDLLGAKLEQRNHQTQLRLAALFEDFRKTEGVSTACSLLVARDFYVPDWRLPALEQSREIMQNYLNLTDFHDPVFQRSPFFAQKVTDYLSVSSLLTETAKDSVLISAINQFFVTVNPGDTLLRDISAIMRPWLLQNGYDATAEYLDVRYFSSQCTAESDVGLPERIEAYRRTAKGQSAPEIVWIKGSGEIKKLTEFPGKNVLVVFWASWCQHCMETLPAIYNYSVKEGIPVVAIALDKDEEPWGKAIVSMPGWIHLRASGGWNDPWVKLYGVFGTPTIFVLNADKVIIGKVNKLDDLRPLTK
jgi:thiol-disulfide isomerase/thioredoxin